LAGEDAGRGFDAARAQALALLTERVRSAELVVLRVLREEYEPQGQVLFRVDVFNPAAPNEPHTIVIDEDGNEFSDLVGLTNALGRRPFQLHRGLDRTAVSDLGLAEAERAYTIEPSENDVILDFGATLNETIRVTVDPGRPSTPPIDIYFLTDLTGSMDTALGDVRDTVNLVLDSLGATGLDAAYGVGNYRDFPGLAATAFANQLPITPNVDDVRAAIGTWSASGGIDPPEAQLFALDQIVESPLGPIGWRLGSSRVILWFGDEPGHEPICREISGLPYDITLRTVLMQLLEQEIIVLAVDTETGQLGLDGDPTQGASDYQMQCGTPQGLAGQASDLARFTGGQLILGLDATRIVNELLAIIGNIAPTFGPITLDPTAGIERFVSLIDPIEQGPFEGVDPVELDFQVTWEGTVACTREQDLAFSGELVVSDNGDAKVLKHVNVTVPRCKPTILDAPVAVSHHDGSEVAELHAFARSPLEKLLRCSFDQRADRWVWDDHGLPLARVHIESLDAAAESNDSTDFNSVHVFVLVRLGLALRLLHLSGVPHWQATWLWTSEPLPPALQAGTSDIGVFSYRPGSTPVREPEARSTQRSSRPNGRQDSPITPLLPHSNSCAHGWDM
jgi:hypothetical protein